MYCIYYFAFKLVYTFQMYHNNRGWFVLFVVKIILCIFIFYLYIIFLQGEAGLSGVPGREGTEVNITINDQSYEYSLLIL